MKNRMGYRDSQVGMMSNFSDKNNSGVLFNKSRAGSGSGPDDDMFKVKSGVF